MRRKKPMCIKGRFYPQGLCTGEELLPVVGWIKEYYDEAFPVCPVWKPMIPDKIEAICYREKEGKLVLYTVLYDRLGSTTGLHAKEISLRRYMWLQELWSSE